MLGARGAKLAGAGLGGTIIALHDDPGWLAEKIVDHGAASAFAVQRAAPGVRLEPSDCARQPGSRPAPIAGMSTASVIGLDLGPPRPRRPGRRFRRNACRPRVPPYDLHTPRPGWAEQSPESWEAAAFEALAAVASRVDRADEVRAIGLTGQMHGLTLLDRAQQPIRDAILWCDFAPVRNDANLRTGWVCQR